jgi:DUF4097 and DUF4098 domain-containing protein YvlB
MDIVVPLSWAVTKRKVQMAMANTCSGAHSRLIVQKAVPFRSRLYIDMRAAMGAGIKKHQVHVLTTHSPLHQNSLSPPKSVSQVHTVGEQVSGHVTLQLQLLSEQVKLTLHGLSGQVKLTLTGPSGQVTLTGLSGHVNVTLTGPSGQVTLTGLSGHVNVTLTGPSGQVTLTGLSGQVKLQAGLSGHVQLLDPQWR